MLTDMKSKKKDYNFDTDVMSSKKAYNYVS